MTTSILNREIIPEEASHSIPAAGEHYSPAAGMDEDGSVAVTTVQTIQGSPESLYAAWRDVARFSLWQEYVVSVTPLDAETSHWVMGNPEDEKSKRVEFDSRIIEDVPGQKLVWESTTPGIEQSGMVTFVAAPSGRGTLVTLSQAMKVPLGTFGNAVAGIVARSPRQVVVENLRHFKQMAETGEIPSVKGQPHGPRGLTGAVKEWMYGDTNPTPPGTSVQE